MSVDATKARPVDAQPLAASQPVEGAQKVIPNTPDTLQSSKDTNNEEGCLTRWLCAIPRTILSLIKKVVHILTCCMLFKEEKVVEAPPAPVPVDPKDVRAKEIGVLNETIVTFTTGEIEDRQPALERLYKEIPDLHERIIPILVQRQKEFFKLTNDPVKLQEWENENLPAIKAKLVSDLGNFKVRPLEICREHLQELNK